MQEVQRVRGHLVDGRLRGHLGGVFPYRRELLGAEPKMVFTISYIRSAGKSSMAVNTAVMAMAGTSLSTPE